jgi:hypothetical protein
VLWVRFVDTLASDSSKPLDVVGVIGLVGWLEVSDSFCADDSFVRFFFRNPSVCFICRQLLVLLSSRYDSTGSKPQCQRPMVNGFCRTAKREMMGCRRSSTVIESVWSQMCDKEEAHIPMELFWNCSDLQSVICLSSDREGSGSLQGGESSFPVGRRVLGLRIKLLKECRRRRKGAN